MVKITKDDIPVILSIALTGSIVFIDKLGKVEKFSLMVAILVFGWYIRKLIKEKKMKEVKGMLEEIEETVGYTDIGKLREKVPTELVPMVDTLEKLVEKIQEYEIEKIEAETIKEYSEEVDRLKDELKKMKERMEKAEEKVQYLQIIYEITSKVVSTFEIDSILDFITEMLGEKLGVGKLAVLLKDEGGDTLVVRATYGFGPSIKGMRFSVTEGVSGLAFSTGETIYIPDTRRDRRYLHWKGEYYEEGSFLSIPIKYGDEVIGLLNFNKPEIGGFKDEEIELLSRIADQTAIAIKNAQLFEEVKNMYGKDPLTGLLTRSSMSERIEKLIKGNIPFGFFLFDIDNFRNINLRYGYETGDTILGKIADILRRELRKTDIISRFGGDEFAIAIVGGDKKDAQKEAKRISELIREIKINSTKQSTEMPQKKDEEGKQDVMLSYISISVGVTGFPEEGRTAKEIFEIADRKLLSAKEKGGDTIEI